MACQECATFNPNEQYFANCGADGKINIWDTSTGTVKHEYTPNLHLSSPCSCIHWISLTSPQITPQSKKRRSFDPELNALAIGLGSGKLLIFSLSTGTIVSDLCTDETVGNAIIALTYEPENGEIITCTQDNKIFTWKIGSKNIKYKSHWKCAAPQNITSILVANKGEWLLCGHLSISLWERSSMELLKTFTGHASEISQMVLLKSAGPDDKSYFISSAKDDSFLSVWSLAEGSRSKSAIASLELEDVPKYTSVHIQRNNEPVSVISITKKEHLHVFQHKLNGKIARPIKPKLTIQIRNEKVNRIPLIACKICNLNMESLMVAYGSMDVVTFEKIDMNTNEKDLTLYRKVITKPQPITEESITKIKEPQELDSPVSVSEMEGRIDNLTLEDNIKIEMLNGDSFAGLLIQGLEFNDKPLLKVLLSKNDQTLLDTAISRLPEHFIRPLIMELVPLLYKRSSISLIAIQWFKTVISKHMNYLVDDVELRDEVLKPVYDKIMAQPTDMSAVYRLKAKVDFVSRRIALRTNRDDSGLDPSATLINFQDEVDLDDQLLHLESQDEDQIDISDSDDNEQVKTINDSASDDDVEENDIEKMEEGTEEMESDDDMSQTF